MPVQKPIRPVPGRSATPVVGPLLRWLIGLLAVCMGLQAVALSAQRTLGRAHHHRTAERPAGHQSQKEEVSVARMRFVHSYDVPGRQTRHGARPVEQVRSHERSQAAGHPHRPDIAHPLSQGHGHGHGHTGLAHHDHDATDASVVYAAEDSPTPSPGHLPAPARAVHDLDGLMQKPDWPHDSGPPDRWLADAPPLIRSHVAPVPQRPPRV